MFSAVRRHTNAATIVAVLALVFAMTGGAFAVTGKAGGGAHATAAKSKAKALRGPRGPRGPKGATGPAGPEGKQGPTGPKGENGVNGAKGENGVNGTNGTDGVSVTSAQVPTSNTTTCEKRGGSEFTAAEGKKTTACNGKQGEPWPGGGTLPAGASEKGTWVAAIGENVFGTKSGVAAVSFGIPLASAPTVEFVGENQAGTTHASECPGTPESPAAAEGFLCIYEVEGGSGFAEYEESKAFTSGALAIFAKGGSAGEDASGTWAVTGS